MTKARRAVFVASFVLGASSFVCLILYFLALTDIWHESGSPDFWHGQGPSSFEWRFLGVCFWPMFLFHLSFFLATVLGFGRHVSEGVAPKGGPATPLGNSGVAERPPSVS
jgi:hypothetical protein